MIALGSLAIVAGIVWSANGPQPSVGLYWYDNTDPAIGLGMQAPLNQLLVRTDTPSLYYKSGASSNAWTKIGQGTCGAGGGTVTSVACGAGLSCAPSPITSTGTISANLAGASCSANQFVSTIASDGTGTCTAVSGTISGLSTNILPKAASAAALIDSSVGDNGTTFSIATNKLTVTESNGNTAIAGTLTADGGNRVIDTVGAGLAQAANSASISLTPASCSANQFVSAIASDGTGTCTAVTGVLSGLTANTLPKASSAAALTNSSATDDGTTFKIASTIFQLTEATGTTVLNGSDNANENFFVTHTLSAGTTSVQAIYGLQNGTADTTGATINSVGVRGNATTTRSAGANSLINYGVEGLASGSPIQNIAVHAVVSGTNGSTDSRGVQVENTSTGGTLAIGMLVNSTATATTNIAIKVGATGGTTNRALECSDGDVVLNSATGTFTASGATTIVGATSGNTGTITFGLGGTRNAHIIEKHGTAPTFTGCGTGPTLVSGSDMSATITVGTVTTACQFVFVTAYANAPSCNVTDRNGTNQATLVYTTTTSRVNMTTAVAGDTYDIQCTGH